MTAGRRFATRTFSPQTKFIPTQKMRMEPTVERYSKAVSVIAGATKCASSVILPSKTKTGRAEKMHPRPIEEVREATMIKSSTDLTARVE